MKALKFFFKKNKPPIGSRLSQPILLPRRFTLIELLIVISIIALLVTLLAPSFTKIFEKTDSVTCMSNQSQFGKAMVAYSKDNRGQFPISRNWFFTAGVLQNAAPGGSPRGRIGNRRSDSDVQAGGWIDRWWGFVSFGVTRKEGKYMGDSNALFCPSILENGVQGLNAALSDWIGPTVQYQDILDNEGYKGLFHREGTSWDGSVPITYYNRVTGAPVVSPTNPIMVGYHHFLMADYDPNNVTRGRHLRRPVTETRPLSMNEDPSCWLSTDYYNASSVGGWGYFDWWPHYKSETTPINLIHNVLHLDLHVDEHESLSTDPDEWDPVRGVNLNWRRFIVGEGHTAIGSYDTDDTKR